MQSELIKYLSQFITKERFELLKKVIEQRSRYLSVVLEDIYQSHNASAVLRTCDCFGIQDVHVIENQNIFTLNPRVVQGASKWLNLQYYNSEKNNSATALKHLRSQGYRIVATVPDPKAVPLSDFDLNKGKTALVFGSEKPGISGSVVDLADEFITIPMCGFTESLNISVSAAVIVSRLMEKLRDSEIVWQMNENEKNDMIISWLRKNIKQCDLLEKRFEEGVRGDK
ncbi:MAG: RNA methyltransferase [Prolixibacteraceae bacterium]|nr:RNA methyltransferase [Prolixibacteraceae bacterium]